MAYTVTKVWGTADNYSLSFVNIGGDRWQVSPVPADMADGIYACEIWAENNIGEQGHWTGWLYCCNGVCHLEFNSQKFVFAPFTVTTLAFSSEASEYLFKYRKCTHKWGD